MEKKRENLVGSAASATPDSVAPTPPQPSREGQERAKTMSGPMGGAGGAIAGGTAGTFVAGPIGTIAGAIAGAVGGWWAGAATRGGQEFGPEEEKEFRRCYDRWCEESGQTSAAGAYDRARPAYQLGLLARQNPDYDGRDFDSIEGDLRHGWTPAVTAPHGDWESAREIARTAYMSSRAQAEEESTEHSRDMGGTDSHRRASYSDPHLGLADLAEDAAAEDSPEPHSTRPPFPHGASDRTDDNHERA
jgi:uncharacterized protein YcfJ